MKDEQYFGTPSPLTLPC